MSTKPDDDVFTPEEVLTILNKARNILEDQRDTIEMLIQYMPEMLYYYDGMQALSDDLLNALREAYALADQAACTVLSYKGVGR